MSASTSRPRVEGDREEEILDATVDLLHEVGYDRLTMESVARRARAGKATLYRRWETKATLVIDALVRARGAPHPADHDTGTLRGDLLATFCGHRGSRPGEEPHAGTATLGALITAVSSDPEFAAVFRERFLAPKLEISRAIYARAIARGEIADDVDLDVLVPALGGIVMHRTLVMGRPDDDETVERIVDHVILPAVRRPAPTR